MFYNFTFNIKCENVKKIRCDFKATNFEKEKIFKKNLEAFFLFNKIVNKLGKVRFSTIWYHFGITFNIENLKGSFFCRANALSD